MKKIIITLSIVVVVFCFIGLFACGNTVSTEEDEPKASTIITVKPIEEITVDKKFPGIDEKFPGIDELVYGYTVIFDANGGVGEMENQRFGFDEEKALSKNTFTREGYVFVGWQYLERPIYIKQPSYRVFSDNQVVKSLSSVCEDITLHAIWEGKEINISFDTTGCDFSFDDLKVRYGNLCDNLPTLAGYTIKWFFDSEKQNEVKPTDIVNLTEDTIFYYGYKTLDLEYTLNADGESYSVTGIANTEKRDLVILDTYNDKPVTDIEDLLFFSNQTIASIVIGSNVKQISEGCFDSCKNLKNVTTGNGVKTIENNAFSNCSSLASIIIPDSVTSIGANAFSGCSSLTIYCQATSKPSDWSSNWNSLNRPVFWDFKEFFVDEQDIKYLLHNDNTATIVGYNKANTKIEIPSEIQGYSVTSIGANAFSGRSSLASVIIPDSVTSIDKGAFSGCSSLTIYCQATSKPSGWNSHWNYDRHSYRQANGSYWDEWRPSDRQVFWNVKEIAIDEQGLKYNIHNDNTATIVGHNNANTKIEIPSEIQGYSVTSIGANAFSDCSSLTNVIIGNSVTSIDNSAFSGCSSLTSIEFSNTVNWYITTYSDNWTNKTGGTEIDVSNPLKNAYNFRSNYQNYYWYKI